MKKLSSHILFWVGYVLLTSLIEFLWGKATKPQLTESQLVAVAIKAALFYVCYYAIEKIVTKK